MKELDLHGVLHSEVEGVVENFALLNSSELPIRIITGNSTKMKTLTQFILEFHNFEFYTPIHNSGEIIVTRDMDYKL
jgi:ribonucleotide monophosphatase NagD (HAD superfamily)